MLFDSSCEALVWDTTGSPLKGLTGGNVNERHVDYRLTKSATGKEHIELLMEIGCNGLFGAGSGGNGSIFPPENDRYYKLETVKLVVENKAASELRRDFEILIGLVREFSSESQLASDALYAANKIVDSFRYDIPETVKECRKLALDFYKTHERALGHTGLHQVTAIGNCHIDTAWLWPYDETKRKAARSWATQIGFMDDYPGYTFAASQAQQFEWVETLYPKLFSRIKDKAKAGSFVPIGGTWVEMDCNLPSGEGLVRQFLYGQRYFESRFGERCSVFWLPDTFGYSSQLPQIVKEADMKV